MAHTTYFDKLVDLVVSCGGDTLHGCWLFHGKCSKQCYPHITSHVAVVEFVEECILKRLQKHNTTALWQMDVQILPALKNCLFAVDGKRMRLPKNIFLKS